MNALPKDDFEILKVAHKAIDDKFGSEIMILDIKNISVLADYFIIATGNNPNQVKAIANEVDQELHKIGVRLKHAEGLQSANWVLLDFGNLIVHVFDKENRTFYDIERIWADAGIVNLNA